MSALGARRYKCTKKEGLLRYLSNVCARRETLRMEEHNIKNTRSSHADSQRNMELEEEKEEEE